MHSVTGRVIAPRKVGVVRVCRAAVPVWHRGLLRSASRTGSMPEDAPQLLARGRVTLEWHSQQTRVGPQRQCCLTTALSCADQHTGYLTGIGRRERGQPQHSNEVLRCTLPRVSLCLA